MKPLDLTRRRFLAASAASLGALATRFSDSPQELRTPRRAYGKRSPFEKSTRYFRESATPASGSSRTPLHDLFGIITPSAFKLDGCGWHVARLANGESRSSG